MAEIFPSANISISVNKQQESGFSSRQKHIQFSGDKVNAAPIKP